MPLRVSPTLSVPGNYFVHADYDVRMSSTAPMVRVLDDSGARVVPFVPTETDGYATLSAGLQEHCVRASWSYLRLRDSAAKRFATLRPACGWIVPITTCQRAARMIRDLQSRRAECTSADKVWRVALVQDGLRALCELAFTQSRDSSAGTSLRCNHLTLHHCARNRVLCVTPASCLPNRNSPASAHHSSSGSRQATERVLVGHLAWRLDSWGGRMVMQSFDFALFDPQNELIALRGN